MSRKVGLHPLVLLNLSDHYIRTQQSTTVTTTPTSSNLLGVILGNEQDGILQLINSFEIIYEEGVPDLNYFQTRLEQQSVILPNEYLVGVYETSTSKDLKPSDYVLQLHELLKDYNNQLITLVFNPESASKTYTNQKFVKVYDNEKIELKYDVDTKEAEKVAIDTVLDLKDIDNEDELNKATEQIESQQFTLKTLQSKIKLIIEYLNNSNPEKKQGYYDIIRHVNSFISKIQYKQDESIQTKLLDLETDYNMLISLGSLSENIKTLDNINLGLKRYDN